MLYKTEPWKHQKDAVAFAMPKLGVMLAMDMGTGKTKTTIDIMQNRDFRCALIACPKAVVGVWPNEFDKHSAVDVLVHPCTQDNGRNVKERTKAAECAYQLATRTCRRFACIVNYESLWREPFASWVQMIPWDHFIMDESHKIKSVSGKASFFCYTLSKRVKYKMALTGTPMPHSPNDIYAQYRAIDPTIYPRNFSLFKAMYNVLGGFKGKQTIGFQNQEDLSRRYHKIAFQVKSEDVLDLPPFTDTFIELDMSTKGRKAYDQMVQDFVAEVDTGVVTAANAMVKLLRLMQMTSGVVTPETLDGPQKPVVIDTTKLDALVELLDNLPRSEPVVVFTAFKQDVEMVRTAVALVRGSGKKTDLESDRQRLCGELTGQANDLSAFQQGNYDAIAVNIKSGGAGVDLTRAAYCIYLCPGLSLGDYNQTRARVHRPGQDRTVHYYHIILKKTVDVRLYKGLTTKEDLVNSILEDVRERGVAALNDSDNSEFIRTAINDAHAMALDILEDK